MGQNGETTPENIAEPEKDSPPQRKTWKVLVIAAGLFAFLFLITALPAIIHRDREVSTPLAGLAIDKNFPDPGIAYLNKTWYAFATNSIVNGLADVFHVPVATSPDFQHWNVTSTDALPTLAEWETPEDHWAPDVIQRDDGKFVLHYSGEARVYRRHHCIGVAVSVSDDPLGPYVPEPEPLACHLEEGGAIDSAGFADSDGTAYVLYKVDGNSVGNGGDCNNGVEPILSTPIMLQKLKSDHVTKDGDPVQIFDRDDSDGPLVEAPYLIKSKEDIYFLFFSSHCFTSVHYNVNYATAKSIEGPYERSEYPLLQTGNFGLLSPGGAVLSRDGTKIAFHGDCSPGRCMYAGNITLSGTHASVDLVEEGFL
ncbi:hypothetical protein FQN54_007058 [Arachnomyces sp. PD_36]|nr:hypothetical protein FQN54_007058 [Arachnomyces sp. PD_36]